MSYRAGYATICSELASNGFIVAAPEHRHLNQSTNMQLVLLINYIYIREHSACLSYNLVKDSQGNYKKKEWVEFSPTIPEKDDMSLRNSQLLFRAQECIRTLDILIKLNEGQPLNHLLLSTVDLNQFKVS